MDATFTRRDVLAKGIPAMAMAGAGLGALEAYGQEEESAGKKEQKKQPSGTVHQLMTEAWSDGEYKLPKLPYGYDALEPHIDKQTMTLHHDKHHQGYVDGLNKALKALGELRGGGELDATKLSALQRNLSFNGGGHMLHTIFWATMGPDAGGSPQGPLAEAIDKSFGSFDAFKKYFAGVAGGIKGSGWALLAYEPVGDSLMVFGLNEHDTKLIAGAFPLLPIDVWEHAYYLKYQNKRAEYVDAWWNVVNWSAVNDAYVWARSRCKE